MIFSLYATAKGGSITEVELIDGTIISGNIISMSNGTYTVRSDTLGELQIKETHVRRIGGNTTPDSGKEQIQSLQHSMLGNEDIMKIINSLLNDPDFQEVLQDEEIMQAISSGDIMHLKTNPKIERLFNKPALHQIKQKVEE